MAVADSRGFRRAAARCHVSQPADPMVAGSAAITLLPRLALAVERRRSTLAIRRFAAPVPGRTLVLAWRRQSPFRAALRALAGAMRAPAAARPHRREPGAPRTTRPQRVGHRMNGGRR